MKKTVCISICILMILLITSMPTAHIFAEQHPVSIYINGVSTELGTSPVFQNDRILIPARDFFERLGAVVDWNPQMKQIKISSDWGQILLGINKESALFNGQAYLLDSPPRLMDSRIMIPLRFVAELLGCSVTWDQKSRRVDIYCKSGTLLPDAGILPVVGSKEVLMELLGYSESINDYINNSFSSSELTTAEKSVEDHSVTNSQIEGVEEGDLIKTDGEKIYLINRNSLFILTSDPQKPEILSRISFDQQGRFAKELFIDSDKLVVIGGCRKIYPCPDTIGEVSIDGFVCKNCLNSTFVQMFDISDPVTPVLLYDRDFEGNLVSARVISGMMYFTTNKAINYSMLKTEIYGEKKELLEFMLKPKYSDNLSFKTVVLEYDEIGYFPDHVTPGFMLTVGIDLASGKTDVDAYLGRADSVYASHDNMYLAVSRYDFFTMPALLPGTPACEVTTSIYRFAMKDGDISFAAKGRIPGRILNQFSLDEHDHKLRVAVTHGALWDPQDIYSNSIYILNEDLSVEGKLTDIAEGERIYSSRFDNDRIYIVTYRDVDPFFVIDASDPKDPRVLGYLKIPGFSTYLHILGDGNILGFGTETAEQDGRVTTGGLKLSLFDVTVPEYPVEKQKEVIGLAGTGSDIQHDHRPLMIDTTKGIMAFPVSAATVRPYHIDFCGAYVYTITTGSFDYLGRISHLSDSISRVVYVGNYLYSLSEAKLMVTHINNMSYCGELIFP